MEYDAVKDAENLRRRQGFRAHGIDLYFIQNTVTRAIKIGMSANVNLRLKELQAHTDCELHLLLVVAGRGDAELTLHRLFADSRISGEWFRPSEELTELILLLQHHPIIQKLL